MAERGSYDQLMANDGAFADFLRNYDSKKNEEEKESKDRGVFSRSVSTIHKERKDKEKEKPKRGVSFARQVYSTSSLFFLIKILGKIHL